MPRGQYDRKAAAAKRATKAKTVHLETKQAARKTRTRKRRVKTAAATTAKPVYLEDRVAALESQLASIGSALRSL